jgi:hypothetical protein
VPVTRAALVLLAGVASGCGASEYASSDRTPPLTVTVEFRALWWSLDQMEGLDLDAPPPKETEVVLDTWEYTDPIGVPNPDRFDIVVRIENTGEQPVGAVELRTTTRWGIGPLYGDSAETWRDADAIPNLGPVSVAATESQLLRLGTIDLKSIQNDLYDRDLWPWVFEVTVSVFHPSMEGGPLLTRTVRLPIYPGD